MTHTTEKRPERPKKWRCSACGDPPNATDLSGNPPNPLTHILNHYIRNVDRKIFGLPELPIPSIEFRP